ncbi:PH domain-containing protein [Candidatus Dojkabacteria bacterium]|uniref:PH domain-containing protein n=1 Tax=Candidatus Dojkabacteria bacterium TaxID=2099670 RepID=A0A955I5E1_9BACT|nr:PH domain-containing protein [Candidatus Dojkabacteria bacterium]
MPQMPTSSAPTTRPATPSQWSDVISRQYLEKVLPEHRSSLLGGLQLRPKNVRFASQNKGEKVYILLRKHWLTNLGWITNAAFMSVVPIIIYFVVGLFNQDLIELVSPKLYLLVLVSYYALILTMIIRSFIEWYFNVYLVTNERVIDFDVKVATTTTGSSELALENIEEVKEKSVGILQAIFNYGDVYIYSAAHKSEILFDDIPRPSFVQDKISDLSKLVKETKNGI